MSGRKILRRFSSSISDLLSIQSKKVTEEVDGGTPLHNAVQMGNAILAQKLIECKTVWVDEEDGKGRTALHYAMELNSPEIARLLLACGANVDVVDFHGTSALHLAAKDGMIDLIDLLFYYHCDVCPVDKTGKTPFDLACEFGKEKMVERFLTVDVPVSTLQVSGAQHNASALHLAARMGHLHVVMKLLEHGWNLNTATITGSALHEAAGNGKAQVVRFMLHAGIDTTITNNSGQTALEFCKSSKHRNPITYKEIRFLLKDHKKFVYAEALREVIGVRADDLSFNKGDTVWVIGQGNQTDERWKGVIFGQKGNSRCGHFTPSAVKIVEKPSPVITMSNRVGCQSAGGLFTPGPLGGPKREAKKVCVPVVPNMAIVNNRAADELNRNKSALSYRSLASPSRMSDDRSSDSQNGNRTSRPHILSMPSQSSFGDYGTNCHISSFGKPNNGMSYPSTSCHLTDQSHRNSTGSSSSNASSGFESMKSSNPGTASASSSSSSFHTTSLTPSSHSGQLDSPPSRISVHSSGSAGSNPSSLASCSVDALDDSSYGSFQEQSALNVTEMVSKGVPEAEIVALWLDRLGMSEYLSLFLTQGYDLSSIARITPEDLCALGVASPAHRKRLISEIHNWSITDSWPSVPPSGGLREWLSALALPEYISVFESQRYHTVEEVMKLTWEDFEDIGIKRLGHLKRLGLAIKKLKDNRHNLYARTAMDMHRVPTQISSPGVSRARTNDPPPPAPPSSFQSKTGPHSNIDYLSYARGNKNPPPPPIRSSTEDYPKLTGQYGSLFEKYEPMKLNLVPAGRILSEASRDPGPPFPAGPLGSSDCPPPPAPLFCEGSIRRLQCVFDGSNASLEQLPFANENCGTIRSRDTKRTPLTSLSQPQTPRKNVGMMFENTNAVQEDKRLPHPSNNNQTPNVLNDIGYMLQNLTDELDAMLSPPPKQGMPSSFPEK